MLIVGRGVHDNRSLLAIEGCKKGDAGASVVSCSHLERGVWSLKNRCEKGA